MFGLHKEIPTSRLKSGKLGISSGTVAIIYRFFLVRSFLELTLQLYMENRYHHIIKRFEMGLVQIHIPLNHQICEMREKMD